MATAYEWLVEVLDQHGDIEDVRYQPSARDMLAEVASERAAGRECSCGVVRNVGRRSCDCPARGLACSDACWDLDSRSWAYIADDALPEEFDCGAKVPRRLHDELRRAQLAA
jgi:hypothetical protein